MAAHGLHPPALPPLQRRSDARACSLYSQYLAARLSLQSHLAAQLRLLVDGRLLDEARSLSARSRLARRSSRPPAPQTRVPAAIAAAHALEELASTSSYEIAYLFSTFNQKLEETISRFEGLSCACVRLHCTAKS